MHFETLTASGYAFQPGARGDRYRDVSVLCERGEMQAIVFAFGGLHVSDRLGELAPEMLAELVAAAVRSYES